MRPADSIIFISDEVSQDLDVVVRFARKHGLRGFELRSMFGRAFKDLTAADIRQIRERTEGEGLRVFGCASPVFKCALGDARATAEHREIFQRTLANARELHTGLIRIFTFDREGVSPDAGRVARIAEQVAPLLELGHQAGIDVAVENECSCSIATVPEVQSLLGALPGGTARIIWDPCNVLYLPEAPSAATIDPTPIVPAIVHVHVKDASRLQPGPGNAAAEAKPVGDGEVDWARQIAALRSAGYRGLFSLETHWRHQALDHAALHLPAGFAFSAGGEAASEVCLDRLRQFVG